MKLKICSILYTNSPIYNMKQFNHGEPFTVSILTFARLQKATNYFLCYCNKVLFFSLAELEQIKS